MRAPSFCHLKPTTVISTKRSDPIVISTKRSAWRDLYVERPHKKKQGEPRGSPCYRIFLPERPLCHPERPFVIPSEAEGSLHALRLVEMTEEGTILSSYCYPSKPPDAGYVYELVGIGPVVPPTGLPSLSRVQPIFTVPQLPFLPAPMLLVASAPLVAVT